MSENCLVTGSSGLIGSEDAVFCNAGGFAVRGLDHNQPQAFFGRQGSTRSKQEYLRRRLLGFAQEEPDVRDCAALLELVGTLKLAFIIHTATQPSHDLAARIPLDAYDVNAASTLDLLEVGWTAMAGHSGKKPDWPARTNSSRCQNPN